MATEVTPADIEAAVSPTITPAPAATATMEIIPTAATQAAPSSHPAITTMVYVPSEDKGKKIQEPAAAVGPTDGFDSEKTVSTEKVVQSSCAKDTLLEHLAPLVEEGEKIRDQFAILKDEIEVYRNANKNFKDSLRDIAGPDLALIEAKKQADELIKELQKNNDAPVTQNRALKKTFAKEISAMKLEHNEEVLTLKTELDEARKTNVEFYEAAEPISDALNSATQGSNTSNFEVALAMIKSLYPRIDLEPISQGYAAGTTGEQALELLNKVYDLAKIVAKDSLYPDEENEE
uniref:Uncharacterized protein n=1 Tax=Leersia perrieri TaxID=77586 RepID=A0A0D9XY12_9ORYZ